MNIGGKIKNTDESKKIPVQALLKQGTKNDGTSGGTSHLLKGTTE